MRILILAALVALPALLQAQGVLTPGRITPGTIAAADPANEDGQHYNDWRVALRSRHRYRVTMRSRAFDPVVVIGRGDGGDWHELDKDDDGGLGTNAHLEYRVPETGRYSIRARGIGRDSKGAYTIRVE